MTAQGAHGEQIDNCGPPPAYATDTGPDARVRTRDTVAGDVIVTVFRTTTRLTVPRLPDTGGMLRLHVVRGGAWTLRYGRDDVALGPGHVMVRRSTGLTGYEMLPYTWGATIGVPAAAIGGAAAEPFIAAAGAPEVRLLLAHASMLQDTIRDLTETGIEAARNALLELFHAVVHRYVDPGEPALVPALVRAARELADQRLAHPELTPGLLARELHVSVRTLSRAFATSAEPAAAYIRRRRLEEARRDLAAGRTVSEVAARWQFADTSHFVRSFRKRYDRTPAEYSRSLRSRVP
ncbi:helix-turn-helix domain-containing protein [Paractinoplanes hotanensis]|uniref:Helix-turn-helix domain-containing protein n=1 Tax=Paractinoplanes hotanensis TaxID=2906497 RepID=A0ABT0YAJ1_9ACTN|nr:helix-turn-helix domain-containing protein [Actinoplanes hotanensis]MCM4083061.1 helix-turn-helix domain-containing protein [Actinoplanes hotanensis]